MNVGLHDADGTGFPNFALMKISAYHKARGDFVLWWGPLLDQKFDVVYSSKVFTFTPENPYLPENAIKGGTGYGRFEELPEEIEVMQPDYSIYPKCGRAFGFVTRGCPNKCPWCVVPKKEGDIKPYRKWEEIKRPDSRDIVFMDNNILACQYGIEQIERMSGENLRVDFNQGLDARLITQEIAKKLAALKWLAPVRLACDTEAAIPYVERAVRYLREAGCKPDRYQSYLLVQDIDSALRRAEFLRGINVDPFAQPYRDFEKNTEPTGEQKAFARWVNNKAVFNSCSWDQYSDRRKDGGGKRT